MTSTTVGKSSPGASRNKRRKRRNARLWIPQYHGAWAMVTIPPLVGVVEGGFRPVEIVVFALWFVGYFLFYSATVWLKSRCKKRYFPPVRLYGLIVAALGLASLVGAPYLWRWALVFSPLVAIAAWEAWKRDERSLISGLDTIAAACLMIPVMFDIAGDGAPGFGASPRAWLLTALFFGYFAGTLFYVKTNIRERGSNVYLAASVLWHASWAAAAFVLAWRGEVGWIHAAVWLAIAIRAVVVPLLARAGRPVSVKAIGFGEVFTSLAFVLTVF